MTMLGRRKRSSAGEADTEQVTTDQTDTDQTHTDQTHTDQADTEQTDSGQTEAVQDHTAQSDTLQDDTLQDDTVQDDTPQDDTARDEADKAAEAAGDAEDTPVTRLSRTGHRAPPRDRRRIVRVRASLPLLIVLAVVAALLGAGVAGLWFKRAELRATDKAAGQAVHAASQAARDLSSYDYRTLESDFKTASGQTTGSLHNEYDALAQQIRATAIQQQAVSQTTVIKAGIESATPDRVRVLVYANRSATTTASPSRLPESLRIRLTMVKVSGHWLASDLQVL